MAAKSSRKSVKVARSKKVRARAAPEGEESGKHLDITKHVLVPTHEKLSDKEAKALFERYHTTLKELPKISSTDPCVVGLGVKQGDIVRITRKSRTAGESVFYRGVIDE